MRLALALVLALLAPAVAAQPAPDAEGLLRAWRAVWAEAAVGVESVALDEEIVRSVEGPRGAHEVRTFAVVRLVPGERASRTAVRAEAGGFPLASGRLAELDERSERVFGPPARWVMRPPALPISYLGRARPLGPPEADRVGGRAAWRLALALPAREGQQETRFLAWFSVPSAGEAPRLLQIRSEARLPDDGTAVFVTTFSTEGRLDLPSTTRRELTVQQRRRLHLYTVVMTAEGRYRLTQVARR